MARHLKSMLPALFFLSFSVVPPAMGYFDTGQDKTPLLCDYFDPNPRVQGLVENVEKHHLYSLPYLFPKDKKISVKNLISDGNYETAIKELVYVLDRISNHPKALEMMGDVSILVKDPMLGIFYFKRALLLYPQHAITHYQYGLFLIGIDRLDEGIGELTQAVQLEPLLAAAHARLSEAYAKKGDAGLARKAGEEARRLGYPQEAIGSK